MLTPGLLTLLAAKAKRGCDVEWQTYYPRYLYSVAPDDHQLGPRHLYHAELISSMVERSDDVPLYTFDFITSQYASFTEHMHSGLHEVDGELTMRVQTVPRIASVPTAWVADLPPLNAALRDTRALLADYITERVGSTAKQIADTLAATDQARERLNDWHSHTFTTIDMAVQPLFSNVGMQPRPMPPTIELVKIPTAAGGFLLLLHSPEPMDWARVEFSMVHGEEAIGIVAVWNQDQTQVYLFGSNSVGLNAGNYTLTVNYSGGGADKADLAPITQAGEPIEESIEWPIKI